MPAHLRLSSPAEHSSCGWRITNFPATTAHVTTAHVTHCYNSNRLVNATCAKTLNSKISSETARRNRDRIAGVPETSPGMRTIAWLTRILGSGNRVFAIPFLSTRKTSGKADSGAAVQCGRRTETARKPREQRLTAFLSSRELSSFHFGVVWRSRRLGGHSHVAVM